MATVNTFLQFSTAREFATFMAVQRFGKKRVASLDALTGRERLRSLVNEVERYSRWSLEDGGIDRLYDVAMYGLNWTVVTGRLNAVTETAILALSTKKLCELVHQLAAYSQDQSSYPAYLMGKKWGKQSCTLS